MAKPPAYDPLSPENYNPREAAKRAPAFAAPTTPSGTVPSAPVTSAPVVPLVPTVPATPGAGFTPGSPFFPYTPLTYDTPAGPGLGRARFNPELMSKAFTATDKMPPAQQLAAREEIYKAYTGRPPPVTTEEIRDIQQPGWLDSLVGMLEPFALPQRGLYNVTALATSSLLPDVGTPAGDTLEGLAGAFTSAGAYLPQNILLNLGLPSEERTSAFAEIGRNVYKAAANDDLLLEWAKTPGYVIKSLPVPGGGTENDLAVTAPSFESIMNRVVPKELAARLESSAGNPAERAYYRTLQSDLGRAVVGMAGELVTDPLLVTGPSRSASKIFKIMESEYRLNRVGVQAAEAIATKTGLSFDEAAKAVIKASGEAGDEARLVSRQMLLDAETDALARAARAQADAAALRAEKANPLKVLQPRLDDLEKQTARMRELAKTDRAAAAELPALEEVLLASRRRVAQVAADPAKYNVDWLIKGHERTAAAQRAYADAARRVLTAADDQKLVRAPLFGKGATKGQTGIVTKGTGFEMGLPFSDQTYSLTSKTLLPVTKLAGKALKSYSLADLSKKIELARQAGESAYNVLTPGETAAYLTQNLLRNYVGVPLMHVHDYIGRTFGTRQWKPMLSKLSVFNKPGTKGGFDDLIPLSRIIDNEWVQLADTNPEVWQNYQSAVERFFQKTAANEQRLNQVITSIMEQAQALAKVRKVNAKAGKYSPELNARYLDRDYTGDSVFQEVAGAVETSADVLTPGTSRYRPDLANLEPQVRALRDDIVRTFGKDHAEVTQSLVAMARSLRGSAGFDDAVRQGLEETEQLAAQLARRESRTQTTLKNYLPMEGIRSGWFLRAIDELDPTKLANTLDRMLVKSGGRAITPDLLRTAVLSAVKGDAALAQDILRRIALGFNKSAPADGVNVLAGMLTGKLAGSPSMTVEQALIDIVNEATDIARLSKAFREGTLKMDEVDTLAALAKQTTRIEIAQARALLGDKAFETALTMMDQLDQPNLAEALSKATNRKVADMEAGLSALLRARKGTDTLAVLAKGRADTISQTLIDLNLPPAAIAQLMERSDEGLTNLRLVQTILSTPNAEQALYDRMRLAALGGNNKGQLDAASEAAFRTAAANIVAAAQRANQPMNLPEEQVVKMAADGLRIAQEELDLVKNALAQLDATKPAKVTFTKAEQAAIAAAEANVEKAKQALEAAKAKAAAPPAGPIDLTQLSPADRADITRIRRELKGVQTRMEELENRISLLPEEEEELLALTDMRKELQREYLKYSQTYGDLPRIVAPVVKSNKPLPPALVERMKDVHAADPVRAQLEALPNGTSIKNALAVIDQNTQDPLTKLVIQKLLSEGGEIDRATFYVAQSGDKLAFNVSGGVAMYPRNPGEPISVILNGSTRAYSWKPGFAARVVVHEAVHVVTQLRIEAGLAADATPALKAATADMTKLYDDVLAIAKKQGKSDQYGFKTVHEFVAEGLSDTEFQKYLKSVKVPGTVPTTLWGKFTNAVANLLGLKDETAFTQLYAKFEKLLEATPTAEVRSPFWSRRAGIKVKLGEGMDAPAPPTPEELALLEAERALKAAREAAMEAATLRSTAKKRALLQADISRKQQNLRDAQDAVTLANQQYATAALQFEDLMRTYLTDAVGAEQDALRALAATYKEDKIVASARQTLQEVAAGKAQLKDVEGVLRDALGDYGLQVARSIAQGARLSEEAPIKVTNVFYVAAKDLANVTADALREGKLATSPVPQKGFALVALSPDDTLSIGAVRTSAGTKSAKVEAALDWVTFNPPVEKVTGKVKYRQLEAWESVLWSRFRGLTQGLSEEQRTEAAFLALRGAQQKGSLKAIDGVTFQELGERYGDIDPDIRPMVEELDGLLRSYEKMFKAHGLDFMADPLRMLKDWGVPSYVPHIAVGKNLIAKGKFSQEVLARGTRQAAPGTASVDRAISTNMAARHERRIGGTVAEINAIAGNNGIEVLTLSPDKVINRYMQANGAISAQDFLLMGMRTGVIRAVKAQPGKSVEYLAAQEGLVPLFTRPSVVRDYDVLFGGTAQDWAGAGVTPKDLVQIQADIKAWYSGIKKGEKLKDISPFASLLHDVPVVQQAMNIEEALLDVRVFQFKQGQALFDIPTTHQQLLAAGVPPEKAWEAVATEFNKLAAQADSDIRVTGDMLNTWFDSGTTSWRLYVPGQVAQSMIDIMDFASYASEGWASSGFKRFADTISNHYKTWFTVTNMAHHVGNALGNIFNNALDLGVYGALNPKTNIMATRLATAAAYVEEYGTLMKAAQALEAAKHPLESAADFALRKARLATFKATGMDELLFKGIDLGDGIVREADTAMRMLQEQGVLSGGHAQYIDINHVEEEMAEVLRLANDSETYTKARKTLVNARDSIILMLPVAYSGTLTSLGIVIPPRIGRMIAKATETQARLANFIGNMRRTGSVEQSAQHVNKFLFNYSDLSAVQKVWLRSIFPFFTWTFKNAYLQAQMALENPAFFNRFSQTLLFHAPKLVEAYERDIAFEGRFPAHPSKDYSIRWRLPHARFRLRIPVPEKPTLFLEGFRTPLESAAETYAQVGDLVTGLPGLPMAIMGMSGETAVTPPMDKYRLLSQVHFAARFLFEYAFQHNIYYNRPLSQLDNAKPIGQTLDALQNIYTKGVPVLSPMAGFLHNGMVMMSGFGVTPRVNRYTGALEEVPTASPGFTHFFMSMSFAQMLRKVMAVSDVYQTSMAEAGMLNETVRDLYYVPYPVRYFDALTGIGLAQEDPLTRIKLVERDARDMQLRAMEAGGGVLTFQKPFIPKQ